MSEGPARRDGAPRTGPSSYPTMRISDVLELLHDEFADLTHSKLRFLEDQGLIAPFRTPSGYRQYSSLDVERLRFILTEQRERYLPLKVIRERLATMDVSRLDATADRSREPEPEPAVADPGLVAELTDAGLIRPSVTGELDAEGREVARLATALAEYGIEPRHLRTLRTAADRHVSLVEQAIAPWSRQTNAPARAHATSLAGEIADLCARLHAIWVRRGIDDVTG